MIKCYLLVKDLASLTPGKLAAQTHHAGTAMMYYFQNYLIAPHDSKAKKWFSDNGAGVTIVLRVTPEIFDWVKEHISVSHWGIYKDETFPIEIGKKRSTVPMETVIWALATNKEQEFFKKFPLY